MEINDEKLIGVMVLVLDEKKKKVLFGKRKNSFAAGTYGIPGGRVGRNERFKVAAKRELKEETGIDALDLKYLGSVRDVYSDHTFTHHGFVCLRYKGKVKRMEPNKCAGWKWYSFNKLPKNAFPAHKMALDMYLKPKKDSYREIFNPGNLIYKHAS